MQSNGCSVGAVGQLQNCNRACSGVPENGFLVGGQHLRLIYRVMMVDLPPIFGGIASKDARRAIVRRMVSSLT